jgi:hypothetical protein
MASDNLLATRRALSGSGVALLDRLIAASKTRFQNN